MNNAIVKLNQLLGMNEPVDGDSLYRLLSTVYIQEKEDQVKELVPILGKAIDSLERYVDDYRDEIVFGLRCHGQILKVQVQAFGGAIDGKNRVDCVSYLLSKGHRVFDGLPENDPTRMSKERIRNEIAKNKAASKAAIPLPPNPAQVAPTPIGSFTVAIPK